MEPTAAASTPAVCQESKEDPRLLGRRNLDGRQQQQQKAHMEELAAEGRKAAAGHKAAEIRPGWSRALREAKVRSTASKDSEVLGALHEGSRVLVAEVCGKKARIQQPLSGWIALSKHTEPVLEQESCQVQEGELASSWVISHVLARLSQPAPQAEQPLEAPEENVDHDADVDSEVEPPAPPMTTAELAKPILDALAFKIRRSDAVGAKGFADVGWMKNVACQCQPRPNDFGSEIAGTTSGLPKSGVAMSVGGGSSGQNFCSSNAGFSGTPLWKLKQQGQLPNQWREHEEAKELQAKELREEEEAAATLRVAVDAVSLGRVDLNLVRHIVVKDLRKAAARSKIALPTGGLFENKAPLQLFALFDGQSAAEGPGPMAAECCAKALQPKLLRNMSAIPQGYENATFIKACLKKAFEDLDKEVLRNHPGVSDGCGGAVALLVGEKLFTAVCGSCELTLLEAGPRKGNKQDTCKAVNMGVNQGHFKVPEDQKFLQDNGGMVFPGEGGKLMTSNPQGATTAVSRSIGDRAWKGSMGGMPGSLKLLRSVPETRHTDVSWADRHIALVLSSTPVPAAIPTAQVALTISDFEYKPRAASGDIAHRAALAPQNANAQCTTIVVYFVPKDDRAVMEPAAKRAKKEAESVRLRHIVDAWIIGVFRNRVHIRLIRVNHVPVLARTTLSLS
ncbi:unnamed protein product [Symbiodinium microadriaticum]|nr:unnamed protein product [Symbiodinium microadriaticum]